MGYTLMAESSKPVDWAALHKVVMPLRRRVEVFPVPGNGSAPDGLGLSVTQRNLNETAWEEIAQVAAALGTQFGMKMTDLRTGKVLTPETAEDLKKDFLSQESCDG
jgi:hypothetical protein